jgi:hypothetical protein
MASYENLTLEISEPIARVTINRPKVLNALAEEAALLAEGGAKSDERYMSRVAHLAPPPDLPARLDIKE